VLFPLSEVEKLFFYFAVAAIIIAAMVSWAGFLYSKQLQKMVLFSTALSITACAISIGLRWIQSGNGPFVTMYEVLISNLFSLGLIFFIVYKLLPLTQSSSLLVLPLLSLIGLWAASSEMAPLVIPATYDTVLLWIHVGVGKIFLGMCLIAFGLAGVMLTQQVSMVSIFKTLPSIEKRNDLAWRFMAVAFVFHSLMLIAGAAWAQDAWGRFWAWDSLETWAFITWLVLGLSLHARVTWKLADWIGWLMIISVFTLALLTFFGVPFSSVGPHKGII